MTNKPLGVFDFDHTILNENSDTVAIDLINRRDIPLTLKEVYRNDGWTSYMQGIFDILRSKGITQQTLTERINEIPPVAGICTLIRELQENFNFDVIIISDSNSYFINSWLETQRLANYIRKVFTNPAEFRNGKLIISKYHLQTTCKLSAKNLCKGQIMENFIASQKEEGINYGPVVYIGDGSNDFCPIVRLSEEDIGCVRKFHKCQDLIKTAKEGKPIEKTGETYKIRARILEWTTGYDILDFIRKEFPAEYSSEFIDDSTDE
ncbi:pyridoxal phosphate phosphatase PHOSPHO2-like isoform X2 [Agrilus planipennis]|nr:pyridoxal phosphate phosphatase PHOSPHO2-like isoform X2 [Agrilus planipennis]